MSRSLNKVTLIGNLGADPEVRSTTGGNRVATFSLATSRSWSGPSGDKQEKTEWHRCVVWNSKASTLADIVERYLNKGDKIYVEGRIEYRRGQDNENQYKQSKGNGQLITGGQPDDSEGLDEREDKSTDSDTGDGFQTAEHDDHEGANEERPTEVGVK